MGKEWRNDLQFPFLNWRRPSIPIPIPIPYFVGIPIPEWECHSSIPKEWAPSLFLILLNHFRCFQEYTHEIERLRLDLMAMREKSGVHIANENYQEMLQTMETQAQEIAEKITYIRSLEEGIENKTVSKECLFGST